VILSGDAVELVALMMKSGSAGVRAARFADSPLMPVRILAN
jgi:hypothetical protein